MKDSPDALAALWGAGDPVLIAQRENAVYRVTRSGACFALRLHRPGYQSHAAILSELLWTDRLAEAGFPCPRPIPTLDGRDLGGAGRGQGGFLGVMV